MDEDRRKSFLVEEFVEYLATGDRLHEDHDLVKGEGVQQVYQFSVLLVLSQVYEILLKTVKSEFGAIVNIDLTRLRWGLGCVVETSASRGQKSTNSRRR